tara:strand:- start:118 stop:411 length:294 start_codon:yes stop_codon:yes gene_type:complete
MGNKVKKKKVKLIKTDKAKKFDYKGTLGVPNPYDQGDFGVKGNVSNLNRKTKKKYSALKKQLGMGDIEYEMFDKDKQKFKKVKDSVIEKKYGGRIGK